MKYATLSEQLRVFGLRPRSTSYGMVLTFFSHLRGHNSVRAQVQQYLLLRRGHSGVGYIDG